MAKIIASSVRKGNVLDVDGKLYVVLTAQNFHPGKGTPVTQVDMRRISDGVKVSERYRTTEQVERAHVEDREHTFLYEDGDGFHFMNPESYDQLTMSADDVGDAKAYLQEGMAVILTSDTLEETIGLSHTVLVMRDGVITHRTDASPGRKPQQVELIEHMV